ncbi:HAMP domain-containing protein [Deinococcus sp. HSC-46F16]|uniref:HAMP domain-containing protein n=1 Tax=Deinococcus sp. HSC-46F16 TaxID=2910968 RepID=UPI00209F10F6|nr:HAMP domain-containing protein [Deinococcus sp. HSC-46F16]MCP2015566.1 HAMP domain-containing protein [Deinococcus sp. HSC-46F16]
MKYTVVIRQPVPDGVRPELEAQLVSRFGLSPEQAARLASRRSGRLMKPSGRPRAELLLRVFEEVGAAVALEEVRDETRLDVSPFEGGGAAPLTPGPRAGAADDVELAPAAPLGGADPFGGLGGIPGLDADPFAMPVPVGAEATREPVLATAGLAGAGVLGGLGGLGGSTTVFSPDPPAPRVTGPDAAPVPAGDDSWSDFTGALTLSGAPAAPAPEAAAAGTGADADRFLSAVAAEGSAAPAGRRRSLAQQLIVASVAPLGVAAGLSLLSLAVLLPNAQQRLIRQNAEAVAVAVGTSLDTRDQETVNAQLDALLKRSAVGFVEVELPDGTVYFRSQNPGLDGALQGQVADFIKANPQTGTFVNRGTPADAYREQLAQLEEVGAGESAQARELRALAENEENQRGGNETFIVSRLGVVEGRDGVRTPVDASERSGDLLYRIAVGVDSTDATRRLRTTLLLVLGISLLAALAAALLTLRATRRIVQPIERLVKSAEAISMGDLAQPVRADRNDEIGDLAQALERMRLSLESAMERLRRRKRA